MRLRNIKNKEEIINNSSYVIKDYKKYCGKWNEVFSNNNPICIEIGMGMGKFIVENALNNPDINYIGIEKQDNVLARALPNIPLDIPNLRVLRLNALEIDEVFNHDIDLVYLNFSDPWPKVRHKARRLTSSIFLDKYENMFKGDRVIELRTDNEDLYTYSIEVMSKYGYSFDEVSLDLEKKLPERITTEYEDKFIKKGNKIYYLSARK